jgi:HlyD family secretion protein
VTASCYQGIAPITGHRGTEALRKTQQVLCVSVSRWLRRSARRLAFGLVAGLALSGCSKDEGPDAYGNVEATEVVVSAQAAGQLTTFTPQEGQRLEPGAVVGTVDATDLNLQRDQAAAQRAVNVSRMTEVARQVPVIEAQRAAAQAQRDAAAAQRAALASQLEIARRGYERTQRLIAQQAATAQQLDQAEREVRTLENQLEAQDEQIEAQARQMAAHTGQIAAIRAQQQTAAQQVTVAAAQVGQAEERIRKAQITNPSAGTVLVTYAREGEVVQPGQPLYKIADLAAVDVRAYVTETQLSSVRVGQKAQVTVDAGESRQTLDGSVSWVASQAEFTPTPIQTREERADLVYAVKIRVPNENGMLKIGMPVDVAFGAGGTP